MGDDSESLPKEEYAKAKDLVVKVSFVKDTSPEGIFRSQQAKRLICDLILLGKKRGRPSKTEEVLDEAA